MNVIIDISEKLKIYVSFIFVLFVLIQKEPKKSRLMKNG